MFVKMFQEIAWIAANFKRADIGDSVTLLLLHVSIKM